MLFVGQIYILKNEIIFRNEKPQLLAITEVMTSSKDGLGACLWYPSLPKLWPISRSAINHPIKNNRIHQAFGGSFYIIFQMVFFRGEKPNLMTSCWGYFRPGFWCFGSLPGVLSLSDLGIFRWITPPHWPRGRELLLPFLATLILSLDIHSTGRDHQWDWHELKSPLGIVAGKSTKFRPFNWLV